MPQGKEHKSWLPRGFEFLSGFPERVRKTRCIVTFQAFFDESGAKGQRGYMSMAGLFGEAQVFAEVADNWDRALRTRYPGAIAYFKMDEACGLDGEFRHWRKDNRDSKIRQMAAAINRPDLLEVAARLDLDAFAEVAKDWAHVKGKHSMSEPYVYLSQYVLTSCVSEAVLHGATSPMEIMFDEQAIFRPVIQKSYSDFREIESDDPERLAVLPIQPWFRDDKQFVVLQAADLLAGELRQFAETVPPHVQDLCPNLKVTRFFKDMGRRDMDEMNAWLKYRASLDWPDGGVPSPT